MLEFVTYSAEKLQLFFLVSFRAAGLFLTAPVIGHKSIPTIIKAGMAILLAMLMIPVASQTEIPVIGSIGILTLIAVKEMLVGLIIGFFFALLMIGIRMAGSIIGFQSGLAMANVMDPEAGSQISIVSELLALLGVLIFLAIDGHHAIISAFNDSYKVIPIGAINFTGPAGEMLIHFTAYAFTIAIKISAPVIIALFLVSVILGVVARTVPQMNIFIVGLPLKIAIGFIILAASLPMFRIIVDKTLYYLDGEILNVLSGMGTV